MSVTELQVSEPVRVQTRVRSATRAATPTAYHVAVIGAGPYGLAIAAHLNSAGIETRVFGETMGFWRKRMPKGMKLRSPWRASHIADHAATLTLDRFVETHGLERVENLPIEHFIAYGEWFRRNAVPHLDARRIERIEAAAHGFRLVLADGESVHARRVVIAMGLANQEFRPAEFANLPSELASHSSEHVDFARFRGRRVAVIGRGQSACESAVLLAEAGAEVELISRGEVIWIGAENPDVRRQDLRWRVREALASTGAVGPFPLDRLVDMPGIVRLLPSGLRDWIAIRSLRPAATAWLKPRAGGTRFNPGRTVVKARPHGEQIALDLDDGARSLFDHVLLGTGYRIDIGKLGVFAPELLARITRDQGYPILSAGFESSVPGLHFAGSSALKSMGPLMRFVWGAGYTARAMTRAVVRGR
jgi:hypothetical protein